MRSSEYMTSLYFEGKKIATRVMIKNQKTNKQIWKIIVQDHYIIIVEIGNEYFTNVASQTGHAKQIAQNYLRGSGEEKSDPAGHCKGQQ